MITLELTGAEARAIRTAMLNERMIQRKRDCPLRVEVLTRLLDQVDYHTVEALLDAEEAAREALGASPVVSVQQVVEERMALPLNRLPAGDGWSLYSGNDIINEWRRTVDHANEGGF